MVRKKRSGRRIVRQPTDEERQRYRQAVADEGAGMEANKALGRELRDRRELGATVSQLKAIREELGVSLTELARRTGMTVGNLSRLENMDGPNANSWDVQIMAHEFNAIEAVKKLAQRDSYDNARTTVLTLVNAVPFVGGSIAYGLSEYLPDWQVERIREFLRELAADFERLKDRVDQQLATKEEYLLMFRRVMREASETAGTEKSKAYRAVLVNACSPSRPERAEQDLFVKRLGDLEEIHVVILSIIAKVSRQSGAGRAVTWLQNQSHDLINTAYADLRRMDLVLESANIAGHLTIPDDFHLLHNLLTPLGKRFVEFIECRS